MIIISHQIEKQPSDIKENPYFSHFKTLLESLTQDLSGRLSLNYENESEGNQTKISITQLLAMYISYLYKRVKSVLGVTQFRLSFALPVAYSKATEQCFIDASLIAGVERTNVLAFDSSDCLVATYGRYRSLTFKLSDL